MTKLTLEDFKKAKEALEKANVPGPYVAYVSEKNPLYVALKENYESSGLRVETL